MENEHYISVLPDGRAVLTEDETILFLRLDGQKADAHKTLKYYRDTGKLKATKIGKNMLYSVVELQKFIVTMTY